MLTATEKAIRAKGLGGSDAAAACGISPWKSPYQLWHEKIHGSDFDGNAATRWGDFCEPFIRQQYEEVTGLEVYQPATLRHPEHEWMLANVDGVTDDRIFEAKTANSRQTYRWGEPGSAEIPEEYALQVQHYMVVTGLQVADVAVLIGDSREIQIYTVPFDAELAESMIALEAALWQCVVDCTPPEPTTASDVALRFPESNGNLIDANDSIHEAVLQLKLAKTKAKECEDLVAELETSIKKAIGDSDGLQWEGNPLVTWKSSKPSRKLDLKALKADHADVVADYEYEAAGGRRFLVK